jgi:hypothetical protein
MQAAWALMKNEKAPSGARTEADCIHGVRAYWLQARIFRGGFRKRRRRETFVSRLA